MYFHPVYMICMHTQTHTHFHHLLPVPWCGPWIRFLPLLGFRQVCTRPQRHEGLMTLEQKTLNKRKVEVAHRHIREGNHLWLRLSYSSEVIISVCVQIAFEGHKENEVCVLSIFSHLLQHSHYLFCHLIVFTHVINFCSFFHLTIIVCLSLIYPSISPTFTRNRSVERLGEGQWKSKVFFLGTCSLVPSITHV